MKTINKLSESELERLALLSEELGEVQQIIGKILRHGYDTNNPLVPNSKTNRELLEMEIGDVILIVSLMTDEDDINFQTVEERIESKVPKLNKWMYHNHIDV